jgi:hypothetical protein
VAARIERFAGDGLVPADEGDGESGDGDPHGLLLCLFRADIPVLPPDAAG